MPNRTVTQTATDTFQASPEAVWSILSDQFLDVSKWAGGVLSSGPNPQTPTGFNGSPHGGRVCDVQGMGLTDERVIGYNADARQIAYSVTSPKVPFFVERMSVSWTVAPGATPGTSTVSLEAEGRTKGLLGGIGAVPIRKMISGMAPGLVADLKKYAEAQA